MDDTLKTYSLICPDIDCAEEFDIELSPAAALADGGETIECPECGEEWEWEYDPDTDTLQLLGDEEDEAAREENEAEENEEDDE
jgi:hypothetical protein